VTRSPPTRRTLIRILARSVGTTHNALYRLSKGRVGGRLQGLPILLLTTTGRKTGKARTNPLGFVRDGDNLVVIASNGGMDWSPAWWLNLKHDGAATVEIERDRRSVAARQASVEERARLWPEIVRRFPAYGRYEQRTTRAIPVVILEPAPATPDG